MTFYYDLTSPYNSLSSSRIRSDNLEFDFYNFPHPNGFLTVFVKSYKTLLILTKSLKWDIAK